MTIKMLDNECWYGLVTAHGTKMPFDQSSVYKHHATTQFTGNGEAPIMVSSCGRYLWSDSPYDVDITDGVISISNAADDFELCEGFGSMREAFLAAAKAHFPANGEIPPENFFLKPQYNTWAELIYDQSQPSILRYAHGIIENNLPAGILMIDDGWMSYYGSRDFHPARFTDPRAMFRELHELGFEVMLWMCPFISPDSPEFRELSSKGMLVVDKNDRIAIRNWWNGYSAILDMSNPKTCEWLDEMLAYLMELGADGFKFDAGDVYYYKDDDKTYGGVTAHRQCELWAELGLKYRYNEYRASYKCGGLPLVERLCDKSHQWESVGRLVPDALCQGIIGYPYCCPDMIGGGEWSVTIRPEFRIDEELFVRMAQVSVFFPMMQFSWAPWRVLSKENFEIVKKAAEMHARLAPEIVSEVEKAAKTGEPILRHLEYAYPHCGYHNITDEFLCGDDILVCPVVTKGTFEKDITVPSGKWQSEDGTVYTEGVHHVKTPLDSIFYLRKIK